MTTPIYNDSGVHVNYDPKLERAFIEIDNHQGKTASIAMVCLAPEGQRTFLESVEYFWCKYIKGWIEVSGNDPNAKTQLVSINSIAKRLHVDPDSITSSNKNNKLYENIFAIDMAVSAIAREESVPVRNKELLALFEAAQNDWLKFDAKSWDDIVAMSDAMEIKNNPSNNFKTSDSIDLFIYYDAISNVITEIAQKDDPNKTEGGYVLKAHAYREDGKIYLNIDNKVISIFNRDTELSTRLAADTRQALINKIKTKE